MVIKYAKIFHCKTLQNFPNLGFLVRKQTIWQPWSAVEKRGLTKLSGELWRRRREQNCQNIQKTESSLTAVKKSGGNFKVEFQCPQGTPGSK
jgi:hypothetical protein